MLAIWGLLGSVDINLRDVCGLAVNADRLNCVRSILNGCVLGIRTLDLSDDGPLSYTISMKLQSIYR